MKYYLLSNIIPLMETPKPQHGVSVSSLFIAFPTSACSRVLNDASHFTACLLSLDVTVLYLKVVGRAMRRVSEEKAAYRLIN